MPLSSNPSTIVTETLPVRSRSPLSTTEFKMPPDVVASSFDPPDAVTVPSRIVPPWIRNVPAAPAAAPNESSFPERLSVPFKATVGAVREMSPPKIEVPLNVTVSVPVPVLIVSFVLP